MYMTERTNSATQSEGKKDKQKGAIAQLGERLPCTQEVGGSIPPGSTNFYLDRMFSRCQFSGYIKAIANQSFGCAIFFM